MKSRRLDVLASQHHPAYVVWELTLRCDQACKHCGSRAGKRRDDELTTAEALDVAGQLAELGAREVVLFGGEAYLHEGFLDIVRALRAAGVRVVMTTGARGIDAPLALAMADAGVQLVSISVDGLEETHDRVRGVRGSFATAMAAYGYLRAAGVPVAANTNINRANRGDIEGVYAELRSRGIVAWQVQLTAALGRAADRPDMILQPWDLLDVIPRIVALKEQSFADGITIMPGNNLGYFGPEEALLRSPHKGGHDHWRGCQAGRFVLGIESNGAVKSCPSLQTTVYVGGSVREQSLAQIWASTPGHPFAFTRTRTVEDLWGFCRACPFAEECMAGCSFTSHSLFGRPGNNPYCHYRARTLAREGKRERLVPRDAAHGRPFDHGLFDLAVENLDAPDPGAQLPLERLVRAGRTPRPQS